MAIDIDQRVDVVVSLGTQPISTATFDSVAFVADDQTAGWPVAFTESYRVYSSLDEILTDGFANTTPVYKFAAKAFGGNFRANKLYVSRYSTSVGSPVTPLASIQATFAVDDTAYFVGCEDHTEATVVALAAYLESKYKMLVVSSQDAGILVAATGTDLGSVLQDAAYNHVITLYSDSADTNFNEGGIVGAMAALEAGTSTLEDKTLVGVTAESFSSTEIASLESKNVGYYSTIAGVNSYFNSKVASGQFFDTIVFSDWLRARISESVYGLLKRASDKGSKIRMDDVGFAQVRQAIFQPINTAIANGAISTEVQPIVRIPTREEIAENDRANRILPNVVVEVLYSNAVHKVLIRAFVSI